MMLLASVLCLVLAGIQPEEPKRLRYEELPPAAQLGVRVESVRRAWPTVAFVVIVPNTGAFVEAVGRWTPTMRFPVLIDDGSPQGREDIGRFVRGFGGASVVRWNGSGGATSLEAAGGALRAVWSGAFPGEGAAVEVATDAALIQRWRGANVPRSGVVVTSIEDSAWPAALALAAGRAQPLVWIKRPPGVIDAKFDRETFSALEAEIEAACERMGLAWKVMGDEVDAVTLCMSTPSKVQGEGGAVLATTDLLGRVASAEQFGSGARWAWTGQIAGTEARCVYAAMCSLFLSSRSAWLFDGYPANEPWSKYSMKEGVRFLSRVGITPEVNESPNGGEAAWRARASRAIDAGLILINSKGMSGEFYLEPGRCVPADVPLLKVPSMLHLVHSWSALGPFDRDTLGGRWLERGVYAYLGSVDEPYLHAFLPSSVVIGRLVSKFPFGAAVRHDGGPGWKLATFGDPLAMIGPEVPRVDLPLPLEDAVSLKGEVAAAVKSEDFALAIRTLNLLGADADVAGLVKGLLAEKPERVTAGVAEEAILPLFRAEEFGAMVRLYGLLSEPVAARGDLRDALWHHASRVLPGTRDEALVRLLRRNIRPEVRVRDSLELGDAWAAILGPESASELLREQRELLPAGEARRRIDSELARLRSQRR